MLDSWTLLRTGKSSEAIKQLVESYRHELDASTIMELAIGYLWAFEYQSAWEHLCDAMKEYPHTISTFFGMAGVAKWCLEERSAAVEQWRIGLDSQFDDGAGGTTLPLLLFFAAIVQKDVSLQLEAESILSERALSPFARNWPGPIANYVLGQTDENQLPILCKANRKVETDLNKWLIDFYVGVMELRRGNTVLYKDLMHRVSDTKRIEWQDEMFFFGAAWSEEFFLARHVSLSK